MLVRMHSNIGTAKLTVLTTPTLKAGGVCIGSHSTGMQCIALVDAVTPAERDVHHTVHDTVHDTGAAEPGAARVDSKTWCDAHCDAHAWRNNARCASC